MDSRVTPLPHPSERTPPPLRSSHKWTGVLLLVAGVAFGFLLAQGATGNPSPVDTESAEAVTSTSASADPVVTSEPHTADVVRFPGTILASVGFGRGLMT